MKLVKALGSIGSLTLASRVLALVRDALQARYVGAGFASDAFLVAFRLPNMFRALFAEGAFSAAFIPMFNRQVAEGGGKPAGVDFAERALAVLLPVLVVFTIALMIAAWPLTYALSGGFNDPTPEQFRYAVMLSRITLPYLLMISLVSLLGENFLAAPGNSHLHGLRDASAEVRGFSSLLFMYDPTISIPLT